MPTLKRYNSSTELWELIQLSGDDILNIIQSETEPSGTVEGRIWLDTSDSAYQGTVFEELYQNSLMVNGFHVREVE